MVVCLSSCHCCVFQWQLLSLGNDGNASWRARGEEGDAEGGGEWVEVRHEWWVEDGRMQPRRTTGNSRARCEFKGGSLDPVPRATNLPIRLKEQTVHYSLSFFYSSNKIFHGRQEYRHSWRHKLVFSRATVPTRNRKMAASCFSTNGLGRTF